MTKSVLGNNPLFIKPETTEEAAQEIKTASEVFTAEEVKQIEESNKTGAEKYITMSFKIKPEYLKLLRDYAYTERVQVKDALEKALEDFFQDKTDLMEAPEKPKQIRTKKNLRREV